VVKPFGPRARVLAIFIPVALVLLFVGIHQTQLITSVYVTRLPSGPLFVSEDPSHPRLARLRRQEKIDFLLKDAHADLDRLLRLTQWTSQQFPSSTPFPNYPPWDAIKILDRIRNKKTGGYCAQYAFVFGQACQSLGYTIRYIGVRSRADKGGHALIEVYVPSLAKWIAFEPQLGHYYVDPQGVPLSILDLHRYAVGEKRGRLFKHPSRQPMDKNWLALFYHFKFLLRNNFLSVPVYHAYRQHADGSELLFEGYVLRWLDGYTAGVREAVPSLTSSRVEDFDFTMDLRPDHAETRWCWTLGEFASFASTMVPAKPYRLKLPSWLLTRIVEQEFVQDARFKPLR